MYTGSEEQAERGRTGRAFTLVVGRDIYQIRDIQRYAKTKITFQEVPSVSDVEEIKTNLLLEKVKKSIDEGHLGKYTNWVERLIAEEYTSLDIAASLLKMVMGENGKESSAQKEDFGDTGAAPGMVKLFINVGKKQNIRKGDILGAITGKQAFLVE